jgi:hypothetical protein
MMSKYNLPTDALAEYKDSHHGVLLYRDDNPLVPNCATCHGIHGATPPGVEDVSQVCGNCHGNTAENYAKSPHERARHFYGSPRCVDCHGNHRILFPSRELFTAEDGCASCHADDRGAETAAAFYQELDHTVSSLEEAKTSLEDAPARLIYLDPFRERLREADSRLIEAGPVAHALDLDALKKITSEATAIADEVHHAIEEKKKELAVRKGAWFVVAFVAVLWVVFLILKLRQIPNPYEETRGAEDER